MVPQFFKKQAFQAGERFLYAFTQALTEAVGRPLDSKDQKRGRQAIERPANFHRLGKTEGVGRVVEKVGRYAARTCIQSMQGARGNPRAYAIHDDHMILGPPQLQESRTITLVDQA